jgi:predicted nucleotide-binding protein (sugar kinase/HSP70/actin superfamily)
MQTKIIAGILMRTMCENNEVDLRLLLKNKEFMLAMVELNWRTLRYADPSLRNDREIVLKAFEQSWQAHELANHSLRNNREIVLKALEQSWQALELADHSLRNDEDFMLAIAKINARAVALHASKRLQNDEYFVLEILKMNQYVSVAEYLNRYVGQSLSNNRKFILGIIKMYPDKIYQILDFASECLQNDEYFLQEIAQISTDAACAVDAYVSNHYLLD